MINAIQHSIVCETLTIWAAEFAAGFPSVHEVIYELLQMLAVEFETCASAVESVVSLVEGGVETCEEISAELVSVEPAIGLNGAIVPVAMIRNPDMGKLDLFRHRMPHWGMAGYLGLHGGCRITLRKRIGSTPELYGCVDTGRTADMYREGDQWVPPEGHPGVMFPRPETCPFCGGRLFHYRDDMVCENAGCRSKVGCRLAKFVSVGGMGIPGLTGKVVDQLLVSGKVVKVEDLYSLQVADFIEACHVTHTDAYVLYKSVERSKLKPMHMLLDGLGIDGVGREDTPLLATCISEAGGMTRMISDESGFLHEFGKTGGEHGIDRDKILAFIKYSRENRETLEKFVELGVAQVAMPVSNEPKVVTADKNSNPPKKKRFNYGHMERPKDIPPRRKMRRRKKPGGNDGNDTKAAS